MSNPTITSGDSVARLALRAVSAFVLLPLGVAAVVAGAWTLWVLLAIAACIAAWEWRSMMDKAITGGRAAEVGVRDKFARLFAPNVWGAPAFAAQAAGSVLALTLAGLFGVGFGLIGLMGGLVLGIVERLWRAPGKLGLWTPLLGHLWIGAPLMLFAALRREPDGGLESALGVVFIVVAFDVGAYFGGRTFGGPKLAPQASPSKTWSGFGVGLLASVGVAMALAAAVQHPAFWLAGAAALVIAVAAQLGDLAQSLVKRAAQVKDSGALIPGHGGVFDRFDGMLFGIVAAAALGFFTGGPDAWARGVMLW